MQSKRHRQCFGADPGRGILLLPYLGGCIWPQKHAPCGERESAGLPKALPEVLAHLGTPCKGQRQTPQFVCKIWMNSKKSVLSSTTCENFYSQHESIEAALHLGFSSAACSYRKASLLLLNVDTRQDSPPWKGNKWNRSGLAEHPPEEKQALWVQIKEVPCLWVMGMLL